jgi:hypothetical protein
MFGATSAYWVTKSPTVSVVGFSSLCAVDPAGSRTGR